MLQFNIHAAKSHKQIRRAYSLYRAGKITFPKIPSINYNIRVRGNACLIIIR
jgi:hypothetical protein